VLFSAANRFVAGFNLKEALGSDIIVLRQAHVWDITAISALDKVLMNLRRSVVRFAHHDNGGAAAQIIQP
jgi:SulP family sulfate permease